MRPRHALIATALAASAVLAASSVVGRTSSTTGAAAATRAAGHPASDHEIDPHDRAAAMLATAGFQDVSTAKRAGYASSLKTLGCFQDPQRGGMGVHYINEALMDAEVDVTKPEALVYEFAANRRLTGLVAHEYIVPVDAWDRSTPPSLFGVDFHRHPTLPLWVLHAWLWKDNPSGVFQDWNPAVRLCPRGVRIFDTDPPSTKHPLASKTAASDPLQRR
jgi:hypothetical protein